jgi:endo-1,4-beta-xylanase
MARAMIWLVAGALLLAPAAEGRGIDAGAWSSPGPPPTVKGERLSVPVPGVITTELRTRNLRELTLRFEGGCPLDGRLSLDGGAVRDFAVGAKGGRVELRAGAPPGTHDVRVSLDPAGGCARAIIASSSLREWVPIGTELSAKYMREDRAYRDLVAAKADSITIGTDTQWSTIEPQQGVFEFGGADAVASFAEDLSMELRGHPLVWRHFIPGYAKRDRLTREQLIEIMRVHIQTIVGRYAGVVDEWDVVNEPLAENGTLRDVFWRRKIGRDYIGLAFEFAHQADPTARLFLNEFGAEEPNSKSDGLLRAAQTMLAAGVPIHGVGFQFHAATGAYPDANRMTDNLRRFEELGLAVQITEGDVRNSTGERGHPERRRQQADAFEAGAKACRRVVACDRFTTWGLSDRYSWLGESREPLPFDARLRSKPAWAAITKQLRPR